MKGGVDPVTHHRRGLANARKAAGFSQERLAHQLGVERTTVTRWECGETEPQPWVRPRLARTLGITVERLAELLTAIETRQIPDAGELGEDVRDSTERRALASPRPQRIGWTEVEQVRATTRALATIENLVGGGLSYAAAAGQLDWAGSLLDARSNTDVRSATFEAVGNLAGVVAFSAFDVDDHASARQCFRFALWCAAEGESWALRSTTFADMARQAMYLNDLDGALSLIEFAQVRSDRLTATARAMVTTMRARLLALNGRDNETRDEILRADDHFAERDPTVDPPWLCYYDEAEHQGSTTQALIPGALASGDCTEVTERLNTAIQLHGDGYTRSRALLRIRLATLMMGIGESQEATSIGRDALVDATALRSKRVSGELQKLRLSAAVHESREDVADLCQQIETRTT